MHEHINHVIDRELNAGNELSSEEWNRNSRFLDTGFGDGDPAVLERIRRARRIADVVVGKLISATDEQLQTDIYIALTLSPYKAKGRAGVNDDAALRLAANKVVAKLRETGWRLFRNPPSYDGHSQMSQPYKRCENCDD
jgi:hypothetical protein